MLKSSVAIELCWHLSHILALVKNSRLLFSWKIPWLISCSLWGRLKSKQLVFNCAIDTRQLDVWQMILTTYKTQHWSDRDDTEMDYGFLPASFTLQVTFMVHIQNQQFQSDNLDFSSSPTTGNKVEFIYATGPIQRRLWEKKANIFLYETII